MRHVMLDLETWGTVPGSALRSIGAVAFELHGMVGDPFFRNIDEQSCLDVGLAVDPNTEAWWLKQPEAARAALLDDQEPLLKVMVEFHRWFTFEEGAQYVWSQGGNFDVPLWEAATRACNERLPWKYWDARCTRTAYALAELDPRSLRRNGTHHNALDDCLFQIECVQESYRRIRSMDHERTTQPEDRIRSTTTG